MSFDYLKALEVKSQTARFTIYQIVDEPVLIMKPATEANKPYFNAVLKRSRRNIRAVQSGSLSTALIAENRAEDRDLFPKFVVVDWDKVKDSAGEIVPFSQENCADFLEALPDWIFDEIRNFAGNSVNFVGEAIDAQGKAGN